MARPLVNVTANSVGLVVQLVASMVFAAVFFQTLGAAGFGLVNFCTLITSLGWQLADLGIGRTVTRELARWKEREDGAAKARDCLFTLQLVHGVLGLVLGGTIFLASGWLARHWLGTDMPADFNPEAVISLAGLLAAISLPLATMSAALNGLERHVTRNILVALFSIVQGLGVIACLLLFGAKPSVYVAAQCSFAAAQLPVFTITVWRLLPPARERLPHFSIRLLRETWAFAVNDGLASLIGMLVMNGDRLILSSLLPMRIFGGYALAVSVSTAIFRLPAPLNTTYFPRFVALFTSGAVDELRSQYWRVTTLMQAVLAPVVALMAAFSVSFLELMAMRDAPMLGVFSWVLIFRTIATGINAMTQVPYTLLLSAGRSDCGLKFNMFTALAYPPLLYYVVPRYGVASAPVLWLLVSAAGFLPIVGWAHRYSGIGHVWKWLSTAIFPPTAVAAAVVLSLALVMPADLPLVARFVYIALTGAIAVSAVALAIKDIRDLVAQQLRRMVLLARAGDAA
jgi:O-antigen/teichoic acid export membrane protein